MSAGRYIGGTQQTGHEMHGLNRQVFFQCCLAVRFDILNPPKLLLSFLSFYVISRLP